MRAKRQHYSAEQLQEPVVLVVGGKEMRPCHLASFQLKVGEKDANGCIPWTASLDAYGYGQFKAGNGMVKAHQVAWTLKNGPMPAGLCPDHLCRVRHCVNPEHLEAVTFRENQRRVATRRTHCVSGQHRWDEQDPIISSNGKRECRPCRAVSARRAMAAYRDRQRAAKREAA